MKIIILILATTFFSQVYASVYTPKQKQLPGVGLEKDSYAIKGSCIEEDIHNLTYGMGSDIKISVLNGLNILDIRNTFSSFGEGKVDIGRMLYGKEKISLNEGLSTDDVTYNSFYELSLNYPSASLSNPILTEKGKEALSISPLAIREICGNYVIRSYQLGFKFFISLKATFSNSKIKKEFHEKINIGSLWNALTEDKMQIEASEEIKKNTIISLNAYQYGGDPSKLEDIIYKNSEILKGCTLDNFGPCVKAYKDIVEYKKENTLDNNGLFNQMNNGKYSLDPNKGPAVIAYGISRYAHIGYFDLDTNDIKFENRAKYYEMLFALENLLNEYEDHTIKLNRIKFLQNNANTTLRPNQDESIKFTDFAKIISENIRILNNAIEQCKNYDNNCVKNSEYVLKNLQECDGKPCSKVPLEISTK
ncbi:hypothetical protein [Fluviispira sanaruensis]|uniref:Uncharacterized protein n=1 Tax=Fluviispira sanaruensis TaxID=2493639 RepID=A0A4P2VHH4_FLUSA|nr:hypothetical protein [Fluviispira sanaruensis]BBH52423.1 hypothetical protein JCM31447_08640 [Fluviispira sanaruensis]